jgi:hypothetical protein
MEGISLQEHFATLEDPRVERTKHHQVLAIIEVGLRVRLFAYRGVA